MSSTVEVSNSATEVRLLHRLNNALRFVTPVILAPSTSNRSVWFSRRYDQLLFSYVRSHTLGLAETWVAVPPQNEGVTPSVNFSLIVYDGNVGPTVL